MAGLGVAQNPLQRSLSGIADPGRWLTANDPPKTSPQSALAVVGGDTLRS